MLLIAKALRNPINSTDPVPIIKVADLLRKTLGLRSRNAVVDDTRWYPRAAS